MNNTINEDKALNFDKRGKFLPGNKIGKIQKKKAYNVGELRKAIEDVERGKKHTLLKHFIRKAYTSEQVLIALIRKLVPDISITEINNSGSPFNLFVTQFIEEKRKEKEINERPEKPKLETVINKGQNASPPPCE